jgi:hypothetical protein
MSKAETIYEKVRRLPDPVQSALLRSVELLAPGDSLTSPERPGSARHFEELAETWRRETRFLSFMEQRAMHPAYQRLIGMGWMAVPLMLRELRSQPDHWLWALRAITGEEPAADGATLPEAAAAWLRWGRERGLLADAEG